MNKLLAALALTVTLAACGGGDSDDAQGKWNQMWDEMPAETKDNACASLVVFGPEASGEVISDNAEGKISAEDATRFLQKSCATYSTNDV